MSTTFPFSFLESFAARFPPPAWVVDEGQQTLVLFINHVIQQEKQAQDRLMRQKGRTVHIRFGLFAIDLLITPAGLVDRALPTGKPDLLLDISADSPWLLAKSALAGKRPPVKIEGDVQLAAEVGWLAENLRWDVEEDLSRLVGDAPAHAMAQAGSKLGEALKDLASRLPLQAQPAASPTRPADATAASTAPSGPKAAE